MKTSDKITRAKVQLIFNQPFYASIMLSLKFAENAGIKTARTDGKHLEYNPAFIDSLSVEQVKGLIAHEVMHIACLHHTRKGARGIKKWNIACDYAINGILKDAGFELPEGGCINPAYKNMSAEQIYSLIPDNPDNNQDSGNDGQGDNDPGGDGGVQPPPANSKQEMQQREQEAKHVIAQAAMVAKEKGKLPAHLQRLIDEMLEPVVNWKDVLNSFISEIAKNDYTFKQPSSRYLSQGLYLPSLKSIERGKFVLMVDTSGSIDRKQLNEFAGEMQSILSDVAESITVMYIDSELYEDNIQEFESDETIELDPKGGGGTDFKPGFEHLQKNDIECSAIVYFTDGQCNSFPVDPGIPTLWAVTDNKSFSPPFGEVVKIK